MDIALYIYRQCVLTRSSCYYVRIDHADRQLNCPHRWGVGRAGPSNSFVSPLNAVQNRMSLLIIVVSTGTTVRRWLILEWWQDQKAKLLEGLVDPRPFCGCFWTGRDCMCRASVCPPCLVRIKSSVLCSQHDLVELFTLSSNRYLVISVAHWTQVVLRQYGCCE